MEQVKVQHYIQDQYLDPFLWPLLQQKTHHSVGFCCVDAGIRSGNYLSKILDGMCDFDDLPMLAAESGLPHF
jgi:hypothetical protein